MGLFYLSSLVATIIITFYMRHWTKLSSFYTKARHLTSHNVRNKSSNVICDTFQSREVASA